MADSLDPMANPCPSCNAPAGEPCDCSGDEYITARERTLESDRSRLQRECEELKAKLAETERENEDLRMELAECRNQHDKRDQLDSATEKTLELASMVSNALAKERDTTRAECEAMRLVFDAAVEWSESFGELSKRLPPHVHKLRDAVDAALATRSKP